MSADSTRYNYWDPLSIPSRASVIGTGTACLHHDHIGDLSFASFAQRVLLDDPFVAVHAYHQNIPLWCIDRPDGWLKEMQGSQVSGKELWRKIRDFDLRREYGITWKEINERAGIR
jgi:hypothetical protein